MKLFILRGFETMNYTTQTYFIATSLEQAATLASELYDKVFPLVKKYQELEEKYDSECRKANNAYDALVKEARATRTRMLDEGAKGFTSTDEWKKAWNLPDRADYRYEQPAEEQQWMCDNHWVSAIESTIEISEDKEATLKQWEEIYSYANNIIQADVLIHDVVTDGD